MTIEIHRPELEALIQQCMATGAFRDIDELLSKALGSLDAPGPRTETNRMTLPELFRPIQGLLTDEEVDVLFSRNPSLSRPVDLS